MRIISKHKDYYDNAAPWGNDDHLTFVRHLKTLGRAPINLHSSEDKKLAASLRSMIGVLNAPRAIRLDSDYPYKDNRFIIGFCGKKYIGWKIEDKCYYSLPDFFKAVDNNKSVNSSLVKGNTAKARKAKHKAYVKKARELDTTKPNLIYSKWNPRNHHYPATEQGWLRWHETAKSKLLISDDIFRLAGTPVVLFDMATGSFTLNPVLKEYDFAKVVDPYRAYQEIEMFLGNNMVSQFDPSSGRTDNEIRDSKGMDKWSFRKQSTK